MVKKLTIVSIVLIVINIGLLGMIFVGPGPQRGDRGSGPHREGFDQRLAERLRFSEEQMTIYRDRTQDHRQMHRELSMQLLEVRTALHDALGKDQSAVIEALLPRMDSVHSLREREVVRYAQSILSICDDQQKKEFLKLLDRSIEGRRGFQRMRR